MSSVKTKNLTPLYAFIQGLYWMNFAAIMGYSGFYLLGSGFSNTEIGIIIAIAGILSAVLQPVLASYADRPESPSLKKFLQLLLVLQLILGISLLFCKSILLTGVVYGCGVTLLQLLTPFINSLGMESINQGHNLNFGIARGMGSVAYAALSYVLGIITSRTGITAVPVCIMIVTLVLMGCLALFPFTKSSSVPTGDNSKKQTSNPLQFLRKYKRFTIVLVGCILIYLGHVLLNSFTFQIVQSKGGGSSEMGSATAIAAMSELPTLFLFGYMLKKARCDIWFRLTGITWFTACTKYDSILRYPNFPDAGMGADGSGIGLLCKFHYGCRRCNQRTGIYHDDLHTWQCNRSFPRRCADRFLRCQYYAPVCNDFCSSWSSDYFL